MKQYFEDGFLVVPDFFAPEELAPVCEAVEECTETSHNVCSCMCTCVHVCVCVTVGMERGREGGRKKERRQKYENLARYQSVICAYPCIVHVCVCHR